MRHSCSLVVAIAEAVHARGGERGRCRGRQSSAGDCSGIAVAKEIVDAHPRHGVSSFRARHRSLGLIASARVQSPLLALILTLIGTRAVTATRHGTCRPFEQGSPSEVHGNVGPASAPARRCRVARNVWSGTGSSNHIHDRDWSAAQRRRGRRRAGRLHPCAATCARRQSASESEAPTLESMPGRPRFIPLVELELTSLNCRYTAHQTSLYVDMSDCRA